MRRIAIIGLLTTAVCFAHLVAQGEAVEGDAVPKLVCDEPHYHFGERDQSEVVEHTFVLRNEGEAELLIKNVRTSCGCTVANISNREVEPGGLTELTARLSLKGRRGSQRKAITVESNDPHSPKYQLYMEGAATSLVQIQPSRVYFGQIEDARPHSETVSIESKLDEPLTITRVDSSAQYFDAELKTVEEGKRYQLIVSTVPPLPAGPVRGSVRLQTESRKYPVINVGVAATVLDELMVAPNQIILTERDGGGVTRYVVIRPGKTKSFAVREVEPPSPNIQVQVTELGQNGYQIRLDNVVASKELDGKNLLIKTDVEEKSEIEIPFRVITKS